MIKYVDGYICMMKKKSLVIHAKFKTGFNDVCTHIKNRGFEFKPEFSFTLGSLT